MSRRSLEAEAAFIAGCLDGARALLERHRARSLAAFLNRHRGGELERALFDVLYGARREFDHADVRAIEAQLEVEAHTVGDVLQGWRPPGLDGEGGAR